MLNEVAEFSKGKWVVNFWDQDIHRYCYKAYIDQPFAVFKQQLFYNILYKICTHWHIVHTELYKAKSRITFFSLYSWDNHWYQFGIYSSKILFMSVIITHTQNLICIHACIFIIWWISFSYLIIHQSFSPY